MKRMRKEEDTEVMSMMVKEGKYSQTEEDLETGKEAIAEVGTALTETEGDLMTFIDAIMKIGRDHLTDTKNTSTEGSSPMVDDRKSLKREEGQIKEDKEDTGVIER